MYQKLPYYMAYPIQTEYDERAERTDLEYMKSLYPDLPKRILPYVEEECDRMEYTGSVIFDVYPDKLQLRIMCSRICENVKKQEKMFAGEERMLRDLAEVLLYQEIYRRRGEQRKRKQKRKKAGKTRETDPKRKPYRKESATFKSWKPFKRGL